jgi:hypothetical protein
MKHGIRKALFVLLGFTLLFVFCRAGLAAEKIVELNVPACGA